MRLLWAWPAWGVAGLGPKRAEEPICSLYLNSIFQLRDLKVLCKQSLSLPTALWGRGGRSGTLKLSDLAELGIESRSPDSTSPPTFFTKWKCCLGVRENQLPLDSCCGYLIPQLESHSSVACAGTPTCPVGNSLLQTHSGDVCTATYVGRTYVAQGYEYASPWAT